jgi:hypothetical protein
MKVVRRLISRSSKRPLPKGLKAAAPIKNKKLLKMLRDEDITTSGGACSVMNGQPLLDGRAVHHR